MTTSSTMPKKEWIHRLSCNIGNGTVTTGMIVADLKGGGGHSPAVWAQSEDDRQTNENKIWEIWSHPLKESTIVVIWHPVSRRYMMSQGPDREVACETGNENDVRFHWYMEGTDVNDTWGVRIRFRSVSYPSTFLDLQNKKNAFDTAFVCSKSHEGETQTFWLWNRLRQDPNARLSS
ncbi:hypothetical protein FBULB1_4600 [Fusarium bulbicola]|nr:hypothetical protein FBULB1_4600 [Fusarium bulbicola]